MDDKPVQQLLYSVDEAARLFGVSKDTLYRWIRTGRVRAVPLGRRKGIARSEIDRIVREGVPREVAK